MSDLSDNNQVQGQLKRIGHLDPEVSASYWSRWFPVVVRWVDQGRSPALLFHTADNVEAPDQAQVRPGIARAKRVEERACGVLVGGMHDDSRGLRRLSERLSVGEQLGERIALGGGQRPGGAGGGRFVVRHGLTF